MEITDQEKKTRQHKKELKSLRNKLSSTNKIWFDSLTKEKQYDLLFIWKDIKYRNKLKSPEVYYRRMYNFSNNNYSFEKKKIYPASLKHLVKALKFSRRFRVDKSRYRSAVLKSLFE